MDELNEVLKSINEMMKKYLLPEEEEKLKEK